MHLVDDDRSTVIAVIGMSREMWGRGTLDQGLVRAECAIGLINTPALSEACPLVNLVLYGEIVIESHDVDLI